MCIKEFTKKVFLLVTALSLVTTANAQEVKKRPAYEVNAGFGMLIYQTVYSMENSYGVEAAVRSKLAGPADWQAGVRLGLGPVLPDFFGRLILIQEFGIWIPDIGIEIGVTARAQFQDDTGLLAETRKAMNEGVGIVYISIHAAPLSFRIREKWRLSALELDFGTHFVDFGRTLRGQLTVVSISRKF
jgi:hypothetical protein